MAVYAPSTVLAWNIAAIEAKSGHATEIEPAHLLLGICKLCDLDIDRFCPKQIRDSRSQRQEFQKDVQILQQWFENWGLDPTLFRRRLRTRVIRTERNIIHEGIMHRDALSRDVFERAEEISTLQAVKEVVVRPCHVLQSLFEQADTPWESLLAEMGIYQFDQHPSEGTDWDSLEMLPDSANAVALPSEDETLFSDGEPSKTPLLDSFGRDLTQLARDGQLDPMIGREAEIRSLASILMQRRKRNAILVGEAGVGKTCIIEGLTQWLMTEAAPQVLQQQRVVEVSMASLLAGSKYRGEFEERIQGIVTEASNSHNTIIFIDEIHTVLGAGGAGASDAANILKPALARGELHCIGATTVREYRQTIEKDGALERRFQTVWVYEPNPEETRQILRGLRPRFEQHHHLNISDAAIDTAVSLSGRYITEACFPDKAIDAIDRACANARLQTETPIAPLPTSVYPLRPGTGEPERGDALPRSSSTHLADTAGPLDDTVTEGDNFDEPEPLEELDYFEDLDGTLEEARTTTDRAQPTTTTTTTNSTLTLTELDVIQAIAQRCRLPIERLSEDERSRLLRMESFLRQQVMGQDRAIGLVADAIRTARSGLKVPQRPVGVFLFVGKTGTGKTRLAQALAEFLFDDRRRLVRIDMSEYMEPNSVSRLVGAPPGYIGHETEGQLSGAVRTNPYSVVLFDEVEKAHPQVLDLLLQVLDEGRLTDSQGREVVFNETTIVLTSNLGSKLAGHRGLGFECDGDQTERLDLYETEIQRALTQHLRPELLNRIGEVVYFYPLTPKVVREIVDKLLDDIRARLSDRRINISVSNAAYDLLVKCGYDPDKGAREMERTVERLLVRPIGQGLLTRRFTNHSTISIDVVNNELSFDTPAISSPPKLAKQPKQASLETEA